MTAGGELTWHPPNRVTSRARPLPRRDIALIDLLDRLLQGGVTIHGQIILSVSDIDLVEVDLRLLVAAVDKVAQR